MQQICVYPRSSAVNKFKKLEQPCFINNGYEMEPGIKADECRLNASSEQILEVKPQINADKRRLNALYEKILNVACEVSNVLDAGLLKKVCEDQVKAHTVHFAQCLNYLRITGLKLCLLLNFSKT